RNRPRVSVPDYPYRRSGALWGAPPASSRTVSAERASSTRPTADEPLRWRNEDFRVARSGQDEVTGRGGLEWSDRRCVVIIGGVQKPKAAARADNDQPPPRRNLARYPRR